MKNTIKLIILSLAAIAVMAALLVVLKLRKAEDGAPQAAGSPAAQGQEQTVIWSGEEADEVQVSNSAGGFRIVRTGDTDPDSFAVETMEKHETDSDAVLSVVRFAEAPPYQKDLGKADDWDQYGLAAPAVTMTAVFKGNRTRTLLIGSEAPDGGYYAREDGSDELYILNGSSRLLRDAKQFLPLTVFRADQDAADRSGYTVLHFSGSNFEEEITILADDRFPYARYSSAEPAVMAMNDEAVNRVTSLLDKITAREVLAVDPDEEALQEYGFDEPVCHLDFIVNGDEHSIIAGRATENGYTVLFDDRPVVYELAAGQADGWVRTSYYELRSRFLLLYGIGDVSRITIRDEETGSARIFEKAQDEDAVTLDGKTVDYGAYRKFYQELISLSVFDDSKEIPKGDPTVTITMDFFGSEPVSVSLYSSGGRNALAVRDGFTLGLVRQTDLNRLKEELDRLSQKQ